MAVTALEGAGRITIFHFLLQYEQNCVLGSTSKTKTCLIDSKILKVRALEQFVATMNGPTYFDYTTGRSKSIIFYLHTVHSLPLVLNLRALKIWDSYIPKRRTNLACGWTWSHINAAIHFHWKKTSAFAFGLYAAIQIIVVRKAEELSERNWLFENVS